VIERVGEQLVTIHFNPIALRIATLHDGFERTSLRPLFRDHRLAVEMCVEQDRLRAAVRAGKLRKYGGPRRRIAQQLHFESAPFKCLLEESRVALNVCGNSRNVVDRQQLQKLRKIARRAVRRQSAPPFDALENRTSANVPSRLRISNPPRCWCRCVEVMQARSCPKRERWPTPAGWGRTPGRAE
jgi:hypothetical protein